MKAPALPSLPTSRRDPRLAELQEILAANTEKLAEAQKSPPAILRKEHKLRRCEARARAYHREEIQENLVTVQDKARLEAEDILTAKVAEKESQIASMQREIERSDI